MFTNFSKMKGVQRYDIAIRIFAGIAAIAAWGLSIWWSSLGFGFTVESVLWAGWVAGMLVTTLQLVGNRGYTLRHPIILICVVLAYVYGVTTNVTGLASFSGSPPTVKHYVIGSVFEFIPEPLIMFAVLGKSFFENPFIKIKNPIGNVALRGIPAVRPDSGGGGGEPRRISCYYCGENHLAKDCPKRTMPINSRIGRRKK